MSAYCAFRSAVVAGERGSLETASVCVKVEPFTVSLMVYVPGGTSVPSGDAGVRSGFALISYVCVNALGASVRRSQVMRFVPAAAGIGLGISIQKFGSGGCADSFTSGIGALDRWRTTTPDASSTSIVITPSGGDLSQ